MTNFEASGDFADWPKNERGKPTQVAVFGMHHLRTGKEFELLWTAQFPDLDKAMYWAAKKELEVIKRLGWSVARRVLWQHDLSPEAAVAAAYARMRPQMESALRATRDGYDPALAMDSGGDPNAPLKPVDYSKIDGLVVDIDGPCIGSIPNDPRER
ncbi:MAG TPA: hypothetical protein VLI90_13660 [Tepidisphaeraceae bacterium]|nr:hypothetical protein [Tepidisphaeraceae bacterium]